MNCFPPLPPEFILFWRSCPSTVALPNQRRFCSNPGLVLIFSDLKPPLWKKFDNLDVLRFSLHNPVFLFSFCIASPEAFLFRARPYGHGLNENRVMNFWSPLAYLLPADDLRFASPQSFSFFLLRRFFSCWQGRYFSL